MYKSHSIVDFKRHHLDVLISRFMNQLRSRL